MNLLYLDVEIFFRETLDYSYFNYLNIWYLDAEVNFKFRRGADHGYAGSGWKNRRLYGSFAAWEFLEQAARLTGGTLRIRLHDVLVGYEHAAVALGGTCLIRAPRLGNSA